MRIYPSEYDPVLSGKDNKTITAYPGILSSEQAEGDNSLLPDNITSSPANGAKKHTMKGLADGPLYKEAPDIGDKIGELIIPKLHAAIPVYHGTNEEELDNGVGHYADSVLPGENDNSVLSGHRDTVFRRLGEVEKGDSLIVRTSAGEFEYIVDKIRIVDKDDRTVIVPKPVATLTVSTCYPFYFVGSAPKRFVIVAYLADKTVRQQ